ncbi:unnamed protein product [Amoebophrya sp. A25]|nr:unnamed protein product [Amoebophrya sp. A25]|eukprot:GSA25T00001054001.1
MAARMGVGKSHPSNVGMMDAAFFVGRSELLNWVNQLLQTSLTKVEQCANGAIYCQILDACHPNGVIQLKKVNWVAKSEHEHIPNYKTLQAAFDKLGIDRNIDVDKLIKGKYQDNLEFLQWMKCYYDHTFAGHGYNPLERRGGKALMEWARAGGLGAQQSEPSRPKREQPQIRKTRPGPNGGAGGAPPLGPAQRSNNAVGDSNAAAGGSAGGRTVGVSAMKEELRNMQLTLDGLETERDYYFHKLREIEILSQTLDPDDPASTNALQQMDVGTLVKEVQRILYKEDGPETAGAGG